MCGVWGLLLSFYCGDPGIELSMSVWSQVHLPAEPSLALQTFAFVLEVSRMLVLTVLYSWMCELIFHR